MRARSRVLDETDEGYQLVVYTCFGYLDPDGDTTTEDEYLEARLEDDSAGYGRGGYGT